MQITIKLNFEKLDNKTISKNILFISRKPFPAYVRLTLTFQLKIILLLTKRDIRSLRVFKLHMSTIMTCKWLSIMTKLYLFLVFWRMYYN